LRKTKRKPLNVLFLDFDGVMNNADALAHGEHVDPANVAVLNKLFAATPDLKIVVSSTWRLLYPLTALRAELAHAGFKHAAAVIDVTRPPIDEDGVPCEVTPHLPNKYARLHERAYEPRGAQVYDWLRAHDVAHFAMLDDDNDAEPVRGHFVRTSFTKGFRVKHIKKVLAALRRPNTVTAASPPLPKPVRVTDELLDRLFAEWRAA
jgi:hypothetical protein